MANTTKVKEVTIKELAAAFEGKYINVSSIEHYGLAIEVNRGTLEYEDDLKPELWLVSRDEENNVISSITIDGESIESIEEYNGTYTVRFNLDMADIDITEYKTLEQLQAEREERQKV